MYKERIIEMLRRQIEPEWEKTISRRKDMGIPVRTLEEELEILFNQRVNCGGYALEIDACLFPTKKGNFEQIVSGLLEKFDFLRLLGDSNLKEDEYIVVYRANKEGGHHFIKILDGHITEKNECNGIQEFHDWPKELIMAPQAVFAAKKEHEIALDNSPSIFIGQILGNDFEETVKKAILNGNMNFLYHNHEYYFERNSNSGKCGFVCSNGRIIGEIILEDGE